MKKILSLLLMFTAFLCTMFVLNRAEAAEYKQVQAYHILVPTEAQALEIKKEIEEGQTRAEIFSNFTKAAKTYSKCPSGADGGKLGWFGKGDMVQAFEETAFAMPEGQVSDPVKTQFGWHLIYVVSKK